jgi:hypothetical protein
VNPGACLSLAQPKEEALGFLRGIHAEVKLDEDQFVAQGGQGRSAPAAPLTLAGRRTLGIRGIQGRQVGTFKCRQQLRKRSL